MTPITDFASAESDISIQSVLQRPGFQLDMAFALPASGITALFGASGSGKTTALRVLAGLEPTARGRICVRGEVWQDSAQRIFKPVHQRAVGYVFQEASLFEHLNVEDNLQYGFRRTPHHQRTQSWDATLALLGIGHLLGRWPHELSGGERQRVSIGRALASSPRLLLLDEPLAALDRARKAEILPYLERLQQQLALPVILVTHAIEEVVSLADRVIFMHAGRTAPVVSLQDALARPDSPLFDDHGPVSVLQGELEPADGDGLSAFVHGALRVRLSLPPGTVASATRLRVLARDVSLATLQPQRLSILNQFPVTITALHPQPGGRFTVVCQLADGQTLLAEITRYSCQALALHAGQTAWALVKSVALMD
ncbi:MAG: molybdenum ABC transporter ATP-binding protein [Rhodoferax sp.]|nr:molybdenum ABC transporter ATP-binding protein [Rhodoferax sp.]